MILNDGNKGAAELRRLTGSYYANNEFALIESDVMQAEDEVRQIVSDAVFDKAETLYHEGVSTDAEDRFLTLVQRSVALLATLNFARKNDVSHEDSGRKVKTSTDDSEKIPWQWQLDRDDQVHLEAYYAAVEALIRELNKTKLQEWTESEQYMAAQTLLIHSGRDFDKYFPINKSERMFILLIGFIREVQLSVIAPAYGKSFDQIVAEDLTPESDCHFAACKATALFAMAAALHRMPLSLIPVGVVREYAATNGSRTSSPATIGEIRTVCDWLEADGMKWVGLMKDYRDGDTGEHVQIIPTNNKHNKFFRT